MKRFTSILLILCLLLTSCFVTVASADIKAAGVTLSKTSRTLTPGKSFSLEAKVFPENATKKSVTWTTSNKNVATVTKTGSTTATVTAVADGTCTITCKSADGAATATCTITVKTPVTEIKLRATKKLMAHGSTYNLYPAVYPENATNRNIVWTSSDKSIAYVSKTGVVKALRVGTATITATAGDGSGVKATCVVTIRDWVTSLTLPTSKTLTPGDKYTVPAVIKPSYATLKTLTWTSSNTSVATVNSKGVVTAKAPGKTTITASTVKGATEKDLITATMTIRVKIYLESFKLNATKKTLNRGAKWTLDVASYLPSDASSAKFSYASSNTAVAKVNADTGVITAVADGIATITCSAKDGSGLKATCVVTVKTPVSSIDLNTHSRTLENGTGYTLKATVLPENATNPDVKWVSSDPDVATVSATGRVTAVGNGTCTITAIAKGDTKKSDVCDITVKTSVTRIELSDSSLTLPVGDSHKVKAVVYPDDASNAKVKWYSTDDSVAAVSSSGEITAQAEGSCYIYCKAKDGSGVKARVLVTVK